MAVSDEDWKKFLDSTEEDPDEVETPDEGEDEPKDDQEEEGDEADESKGTKDDNPDDQEEESDEDADPEEDKADGKKKPDAEYSPRLKQFINSDGTYNLEKVEKSYVESGKRAVQLDNDLKESRQNYVDLLGAIKANPKVAEELFGKDGAKQLLENDSVPTGKGDDGGKQSIASHPLLKHLEAQINAESKKEYNEFVEAHPEAVTDPEKASQIGEFLKFYGPWYSSQHDGQIAPMKEALEAAYRNYGWDLEIQESEDVAAAAKKAAATKRTSGAKRAATKKEVDKGSEFFAAKLGVKLKS